MKTKIYFIGFIVSIILLTNFKGNSQNWAPIGATWYFHTEGPPLGPPYLPIISYIKLESEKDSIINGWNCRKIAVSSPNSENKIYYYMYSDSNKVYEVENNQKYLLYDFNKKAGEYWILPKYDNDSLFVDSTGTITLLNGQIRKVQYVHLNINPYEWYCTGSIIENIGFEYSLFPQRISLGGSCIGQRRCYSEKNNVLLKSDTPCDYQNIDEYPLEKKVIISNPVSDQVHIWIFDYRILPFTNLLIYNSNGSIVYQKKDNKSLDHNIDFSDKTPGVYFLKIISKNNQILVKKLIKY